jgi:hypothetical protein
MPEPCWRQARSTPMPWRHPPPFTEVSAKASGWFDVIWLQGTLSRLGWFERLLMKYYPYSSRYK